MNKQQYHDASVCLLSLLVPYASSVFCTNTKCSYLFIKKDKWPKQLMPQKYITVRHSALYANHWFFISIYFQDANKKKFLDFLFLLAFKNMFIPPKHLIKRKQAVAHKSRVANRTKCWQSQIWWGEMFMEIWMNLIICVAFINVTRLGVSHKLVAKSLNFQVL